jgi:hypothetical protein
MPKVFASEAGSNRDSKKLKIPASDSKHSISSVSDRSRGGPITLQRAAIAATVLLLVGIGFSKAQSAPAAEGTQSQSEAPTTTQKDQTDLSITVYNSNLALVRDVRKLTLRSGTFPLHFEDVAASINPATVHLRSLTEPSKLSVLEQDYEYDLLDPQKLLQKYVGREVTLVRAEQEANSTKYTETRALLLSDNNGPVWKIGNEIVTGMASDSYRFPDLPDNLYSRPTLIWTLDNTGPAAQSVEASYLTGNIRWNADYVLTVGRDEKTADLDGWVTLTNNSGASFENATLQLVAGQLNQVAQTMGLAKAMNPQMEAAAAPPVTQENFSEYHLYTVTRRTSIHDNESKQISLLSGSKIPIVKSLVVEGQPYYFRSPQSLGNAIRQPVMMYYTFKNDQKSGLGMPLPAGTVRVYQADSKGTMQYAGEDNIQHTPKDEDLRIHVGDAFDVVCERKEMDYKRINNNNTSEIEYQISLRNRKDDPITVDVREPVGGDWEVVNSNFPSSKLDATTIDFQIPVDKDGTATLDYRVRVKY